MRTDTRTNTPEDAAAFEWAHSVQGGDDDRPSASELAETAADDRFREERRRQRDDAARARGEYVPSDAMRFAAGGLNLSLTMAGVVGVEATPYREGVIGVRLAVSAARASTIQDVAQAVERHIDFPGYRGEVAIGDAVVWLRLEATPFADPFLSDGVAQDNPPF